LTAGYLCLTGFFVVFITILACHKGGFSSNSFVWNNATPLSGWNTGLGFFMGAANAMFTYGAIDAATHLAEELPSPSKNVPKAMLLTVFLGFLTAFPLVRLPSQPCWVKGIAYMYVMSSIDDVTAALLPAATLFYQATGNQVASTILSLFIIITFVGAVTGAMLTSGRITWAFARDQGAPVLPPHPSP
jgi:choline transport protein